MANSEPLPPILGGLINLSQSLRDTIVSANVTYRDIVASSNWPHRDFLDRYIERILAQRPALGKWEFASMNDYSHQVCHLARWLAVVDGMVRSGDPLDDAILAIFATEVKIAGFHEAADGLQERLLECLFGNIFPAGDRLRLMSHKDRCGRFVTPQLDGWGWPWIFSDSSNPVGFFLRHDLLVVADWVPLTISRISGPHDYRITKMSPYGAMRGHGLISCHYCDSGDSFPAFNITPDMGIRVLYHSLQFNNDRGQ